MNEGRISKNPATDSLLILLQTGEAVEVQIQRYFRYEKL
jgi:hypothetical protein